MIISIAGMTCRSCEVRIERNLRRLPNVEHVSASAVRARVELVTTGPVPATAIAAAIEAAGYAVGRTSWLERDARVWATAGGGLLVLALIAVLASATGIAGLASGAGSLATGGVVVALLLGLAAGVSTCMALVGGVVLALSAANEARRSAGAGDPTIVERLRPGLVFVTGRIAGYALFGAALGALGSSVSLPTRLVAVLMVAVAILMTLVGIRLTGLSPRVAAWSPTLPAGLGRRLGLGGGAVAGYSDTRAGLLGAASFFLPCGFTQAVQIYALSTGSPLTAGVIMAVFAIGTAPGLLALAGLPAMLPAGLRPTVLRVIGVVVIGFAVVNAGAGLRLAGVALPGFGPATAIAATTALGSTAQGGRQQALYTFQDAEGYRPGNVAIYAGTPTRWVIESLNSQSCATFLRIPALDMAVTLHKGRNEIELPAMAAGSLSYACSMGMYGGTITIVDPPAGGVGAASGG